MSSLHLDSHDVAHCRAICKTASVTFYNAANRLPKQERDAAFAIYAFCRVTDDLVDRHAGQPDTQQALMAEWKNAYAKACREKTSRHPVLRAFAAVQRHYRIPRRHVNALFSGVEGDIHARRFKTFAPLRRYCLQVAGTVGLMLLPIFGMRGPKAQKAAVNLGIAMQLTNILRDVREDYHAGRVYFPLEDLKRFRVSESWLSAPQYLRNHALNQLLVFEAARARAYYDKAIDGVARLSESHRVGVAAALASYRGILALALATPRTSQRQDWTLSYRGLRE